MISNCGHDEQNRLARGKAGDQTGGEWAVISWYNRPWNVILRHPDPRVRTDLAKCALAAARNDRIGYDQGERNTFWQHLAASSYDPSQITIPCEADCSSGVLSICRAAGYRLGMECLKKIDQNGYTGNERAILKAAGFEALTDRRYLVSDQYLLAGDVLLYEFHHTVINLDDGNGITGGTGRSPAASADNISEGQRWLNSNYGTLIRNSCGALLAVDGVCGPKSRAGALCVWKDVVNRKYGFHLTPSNPNFSSSCREAAARALIKRGAVGTLVYTAQFLLAGRGLYPGPMDADFGGGTADAVLSFQKDRGLAADGAAGRDTWYALFN